jgi:two-component system, NarL family, sensor kinase
MHTMHRAGILLLLILLLPVDLCGQSGNGRMPGRRGTVTDSLRTLLRSADSSRMPALLLRLGQIAHRQGAIDSAKLHFRRALDMRRHLSDSVHVGLLRNLGVIAITEKQPGEGRAMFEKALRVAENARNDDLRFGMLQHIATTYEIERSHARALDLLLQCLKYQEGKQRTRETAMLHLNIGNLYYRIGSYDQAIRQHRRAVAMFEPLGTSYVLGRVYFALGSDYNDAGMPDSAIACFTRAKRIAEAVHDDEGIARAGNQIGFALLQQNHADRAEEHFLHVLEVADRSDSPISTASAYRGMGLVHSARGEHARAAAAFENAARIAREHWLPELLVDVLDDLSTTHERLKDYSSAYRTLRRYSEERDSLLAAQNRAQMNELLAKYEADQREQQILLLEKDNNLKASELQREQLIARERATALELLAREHSIQKLTLDLTSAELREKTLSSREQAQRLQLAEKDRVLQGEVLDRQTLQRNVAAAGFVLAAVVSVLLVRYFRLRRRDSELRAASAELRAEAARGESLRLRTEIAEREKEAQLRFTRGLLRAQEDERQRIASDLHDSLAQKLVVIQNRATLAQRQAEGHAELLQQFTRIADTAVDTIAEVRAISHALRPQLLQRFGLSAALRNLVEELGEASDVRWSADIDDMTGALSADDEINLYRIVQEGMSNTMRHAHASSGTLEVRRNGGNIHVTLSDDGVGCEGVACIGNGEGDENRIGEGDVGDGPPGMGLHGMQRRAELLGGTLRIDSASGRGTRIVLDIPLSPSRS